MRKAFTIHLLTLTLLAFLQGCTGSSPLKRLRAIDSLVNARPDSALTLLNTLLPDTNQMSKRTLMRFHLLRTNAENKCDTVLTDRHAALMRRVCDYYDRRSSKREANYRMLAHYLLGRCYDDMGEAPAALKEYYFATEVADTVSPDCNHYVLSRVYGGVADLFMRQQMLRYAKNELAKASFYAKIAKDTLSSIYYNSMIAHLYYQEGDMDSYLAATEVEAMQYKEAGREDLAAMAYGGTIFLLSEKGELEKAHQRIELYETKSGLFDSSGHIQRGYETYYYSKGIYYYHLSKPDSAYYFFEKSLGQESLNGRIAATQGLCRLFTSLHNSDSVAKYALLAYQLNDSAYSQNTSNTLQQMQAMYDYSRIERLSARQESLISNRTWQLRLSLTFIGAMVLVIIVGYRYMNRRHEEKMFGKQVEIQEQYLLYKEERDKLESEKMQLERLYQDKDNQKQHEAEDHNESGKELMQRISDFEKEHTQVKSSYEADGKMASTAIYNTFKEYTIKAKKKPQEEDWQKLIRMVERTLPNFKPVVAGISGVEGDDYRVCILSRLGFRPGDICSLMDKDYAYVTKTRKRLLKKIFRNNGSAKDFDAMIMLLT